MKKWLIVIVLLGVVGWFVYDFAQAEIADRQLAAEREAEIAAKEKEAERMAALEERDRKREEVIRQQGQQMVKDGLELGGVDESEIGEDAAYGITAGMKAPDFSLETMDGDLVSLSDFAGKKVLLNFWATWCPPCRDEMSDMVDFYAEYGDDVEIVAVNLTQTETNRAAIEPFLEDFGVNFTVLKDETGAIADYFDVIALPTSYILNRDGVIINKAMGPLTYELMEDVFNDME